MVNSYWKDEKSIRARKPVVDYVEAQRRGRTDWYTRATKSASPSSSAPVDLIMKGHDWLIAKFAIVSGGLPDGGQNHCSRLGEATQGNTYSVIQSEFIVDMKAQRLTEQDLSGNVNGKLFRCDAQRQGLSCWAGSSGRIDISRAKILANEGVSALALQWFGGEGQVPGNSARYPSKPSLPRMTISLSRDADTLSMLGRPRAQRPPGLPQSMIQGSTW